MRISAAALLGLSLLCAGCRDESLFSPKGPGPGLAHDLAASPTGGAGSVTAVVNTQYLPALWGLLDGAQRSVRVVHFMINQDADGDALVERLKSTARRGVAVSVILEDSVDGNAERVASLSAAGVTARLDTPARYTHAKLVVADGRRALLGSTNGSASSLRRNNEANVLLEDDEAGTGPASWFERYAAALAAAPDATPALAPLQTPSGTTLKDGDYLGTARSLLDAAQRRIDLVVYAMNADPSYPDGDVNQLVRRLGAAQRRGVRVRVVLEIAASDFGVNEINRQAAAALRAEGVEVRFDPPGVITHAKVLAVDDQVVVGSNNWGYGGFRTYHEVGFATREPAVVASLAGYFDGIWASGTPAP